MVVAGAFLAMFAAFGSKYAFAAFFLSLETEFDAGRAEIALAFGICSAVYLLLGPVTGMLADRFGPRPLVAGGTLLLAAGLYGASQAQSLSGIHLAYGTGIAFGIACIYVPAVSSVQGWFDRNRGLASGFAVSGIAAGTLVMPLLTADLIADGGWRHAYLILALLALAVGGAGALLVARKPDPPDLAPATGPVPASGPAAPGPGPGPAARPMTLGQILRSPVFASLFLANIAVSFGLFIPFVHLEPFARDAGLPAERAVLLVGLIGIGSIAGRFLIGGAADRLGRRASLAFMLAGIGVLLLFWSMSASFVALVAFALLFGALYGGYAALIPAVCADYFGSARISAVIGSLYASVAVGTLAGPSLAGLAFDLTGSYTYPILVGAFGSLVAAALVALMLSPASWQARRAG